MVLISCFGIVNEALYWEMDLLDLLFNFSLPLFPKSAFQPFGWSLKCRKYMHRHTHPIYPVEWFLSLSILSLATSLISIILITGKASDFKIWLNYTFDLYFYLKFQFGPSYFFELLVEWPPIRCSLDRSYRCFYQQ